MKRIFALLACMIGAPATAQITDGIATLDILPGWQQRDGTHMAGLRITLAPGWKTYWRAPGDAGIPPQVAFGTSINVASARFFWPVPTVFDQNGMRSIGYAEQVIIPVEIAPKQDDAPIRLRGIVDIGVCEDICVPVQFSLDAVLPQDGARDPAIVASLVDRPMTAREADVTSATCRIMPTTKGIAVTATLTLPHTGGTEVVVIEAGDPAIWVSEPDTTRQGQTLTATADLVHTQSNSIAVDRSAIRITVLGESRAVDIRGCTAG